MKTESRKEPKHQTPSQMPRSQPPRQSARPKKVPVQRSRAARRLAEWMNMSVDVFAEICSHLFPIDPLHLSWGSKRLCSIPISKSARHIWHSARKGQLPTLPPCTDDLSEPRYIALLFTNICQVCGANRARLFHFTMRTRHSTSCYKTHAVTFKSLLWEGTLKDLGDHEAINLLAVVPENSALKAASSTRIHLKPALKNTGLSRVPSCEQNTSQPWGQKPRRLENTQKASKSNKKMRYLKLAGTEYRRSSWNWLGDGGFSSLLQHGVDEAYSKPQALTDKVWKNLYPKLQPMLQTYRISRLEDERIDRREERRITIMEYYREYQQSGNPNDIFYPTSLWTVPCVLKLLDDDYAGQVTEARWQACIPEVEAALRQETEKILKEVKSWYKACTTTVIEGGPSERKSRKSTRRAAKKTSTKEEAHNLSLVIAVFKCRQCGISLWLSTFLGHVHFKAQYERDHRWTQEDTTTTRSKLSGTGALVYDGGLREIVPKVLAAMNYDPPTATVQNLVIAPGDMYACDRCDDKHQDPAEFGDLLSHYQSELEWYRTKGDPKKPNTHSLEPQRKGRKRTLQPVTRILNEDAQTMESNYWASMAVHREKEGQPGYYHNGYWSVICHADGRGRSCSHCGYVTYGMCSIGKMVHHLEAKHEIVPKFEQLDSISWNDGIAVEEMFDLMDEDDDSSEENGYYDHHDW